MVSVLLYGVWYYLGHPRHEILVRQPIMDHSWLNLICAVLYHVISHEQLFAGHILIRAAVASG